ncbi:MAG TPA: hypothetical protein VGO16_14375 [Pseudonocardiaceae bacterium]|nr:hypothetical protein [Pseudonocardiaceae bacterium]
MKFVRVPFNQRRFDAEGRQFDGGGLVEAFDALSRAEHAKPALDTTTSSRPNRTIASATTRWMAGVAGRRR